MEPVCFARRQTDRRDSHVKVRHLRWLKPGEEGDSSSNATFRERPTLDVLHHRVGGVDVNRGWVRDASAETSAPHGHQEGTSEQRKIRCAGYVHRTLTHDFYGGSGIITSSCETEQKSGWNRIGAAFVAHTTGLFPMSLKGLDSPSKTLANEDLLCYKYRARPSAVIQDTRRQHLPGQIGKFSYESWLPQQPPHS